MGASVAKTESTGTPNAVELQWLEHLLNHGNMFKTEEVRANKC